MAFTPTGNIPDKTGVTAGSFIQKDTLTQQADNDRNVFCNHNQQLLISEFRNTDLGSTDNDRAFFTSSVTNWTCLATGLIFQVPYRVPGTNNLTTNSAPDPGGLTVKALLQGAELLIRYRPFGGFPSPSNGTLIAPGVFSTATVANPGALAWVTGGIPFPVPTSAGDYFQIDLFFRAPGGAGYCAGYTVYETNLLSANP